MVEFAEKQWDESQDESEGWLSAHQPKWIHRDPVDELRRREGEAQMWLPPVPRIVAAFRRGFSDSEISKSIVCNPRIQGGTPTFIGTRIPVYVALEYLSDVASFARTLKEFPEVSRAHLLAALRLAAAVLSL